MNRILRLLSCAILAVALPTAAAAQSNSKDAPTDPSTQIRTTDAAARAFSERIEGTWRADLNAVVAGRIAQTERPGLAAIFGAFADDLLGENYGIVHASADGDGSARGVWMQSEFSGAGTYSLDDIDGDRATIHIIAPDEGVNHRFRIAIVSDSQIDAHYEGQTITFRRL